jgi:hypothetical protein
MQDEHSHVYKDRIFRSQVCRVAKGLSRTKYRIVTLPQPFVQAGNHGRRKMHYTIPRNSVKQDASVDSTQVALPWGYAPGENTLI